MLPALPGLSPPLPGAPRLVVGAPSYSEGRQECPPIVWYSPEIDASKFTLHILSDTPGGFQWLKYILLMLCNATRRLCDGKRLFLHQRVRGSITAVRAVRNTRVFLTETRVVADLLASEPHEFCEQQLHKICAAMEALAYVAEKVSTTKHRKFQLHLNRAWQAATTWSDADHQKTMEWLEPKIHHVKPVKRKLFNELFQHHEWQLWQEVGTKATGPTSIFTNQVAPMKAATKDEA